ALLGTPVDLHARIERALNSELCTNLDARLRTYDRDTDAQRSADEQSKSGMRGNVELGAAIDVSVFFVRGIILDAEFEFLQFARPDARAQIQSARDIREDADALPED